MFSYQSTSDCLRHNNLAHWFSVQYITMCLIKRRATLRYSTSKKCRDLEIRVRGHSKVIGIDTHRSATENRKIFPPRVFLRPAEEVFEVEWLGYRTEKEVWRYLQPPGCNRPTRRDRQTDGRTDRQTDGYLATAEAALTHSIAQWKRKLSYRWQTEGRILTNVPRYKYRTLEIGEIPVVTCIGGMTFNLDSRAIETNNRLAIAYRVNISPALCDTSKHLTALCTTDTGPTISLRATPYSTAPMLGGGHCPLNQSWGCTCPCCPRPPLPAPLNGYPPRHPWLRPCYLFLFRHTWWLNVGYIQIWKCMVWLL